MAQPLLCQIPVCTALGAPLLEAAVQVQSRYLVPRNISSIHSTAALDDAVCFARTSTDTAFCGFLSTKYYGHVSVWCVLYLTSAMGIIFPDNVSYVLRGRGYVVVLVSCTQSTYLCTSPHNNLVGLWDRPLVGWERDAYPI